MFIAGLMRAFSDGADIISLAAHVSIGGFAEDPLSVVVDRIVSQGTFVTVCFLELEFRMLRAYDTHLVRLRPATMVNKVCPSYLSSTDDKLTLRQGPLYIPAYVHLKNAF